MAKSILPQIQQITKTPGAAAIEGKNTDQNLCVFYSTWVSVLNCGQSVHVKRVFRLVPPLIRRYPKQRSQRTQTAVDRGSTHHRPHDTFDSKTTKPSSILALKYITHRLKCCYSKFTSSFCETSLVFKKLLCSQTSRNPLKLHVFCWIITLLINYLFLWDLKLVSHPDWTAEARR